MMLVHCLIVSNAITGYKVDISASNENIRHCFGK